jgi:hypothetical protein
VGHTAYHTNTKRESKIKHMKCSICSVITGGANTGLVASQTLTKRRFGAACRGGKEALSLGPFWDEDLQAWSRLRLKTGPGKQVQSAN